MPPNWKHLLERAVAQRGYFSTKQAEAAGVSRPLLVHEVKKGAYARVFHGMYRMSDYPAPLGPKERVMPFWLWSDHECVFSHQTSLVLHGVWPGHAPMFVSATIDPEHMKRRKAPPGLALYRATLLPSEHEQMAPDPYVATSVSRAIQECVAVAEGRGAYAPLHRDLVLALELIDESGELSFSELRVAEAAVARLAPKPGSR